MTRPTAAYVGGKLTHPIRVSFNTHVGHPYANFLSIVDALELATDLLSAVNKTLSENTNADPTARALRVRAADDCA